MERRQEDADNAVKMSRLVESGTLHHQHVSWSMIDLIESEAMLTL